MSLRIVSNEVSKHFSIDLYQQNQMKSSFNVFKLSLTTNEAFVNAVRHRNRIILSNSISLRVYFSQTIWTHAKIWPETEDFTQLRCAYFLFVQHFHRRSCAARKPKPQGHWTNIMRPQYGNKSEKPKLIPILSIFILIMTPVYSNKTKYVEI